jgi:molecular chaperone DnaK (HSP70)
MGKININIAKGSLEKPKVVLGIDLGTTNSLAAYVPKGESSAEVISIRGNETVPSVIHFNDK